MCLTLYTKIKIVKQNFTMYCVKTESPKTEFTRKFKILMLNKNISQRELALQAGISEQLLSFIINGWRRGLPYRAKICKILDVKESDIWNGN
jgi:DNA-binding Xre family transcriptional regulator